MRICPFYETTPFYRSRPKKESSASCYLALVRRFLRPCVFSTSRVLHLVMFLFRHAASYRSHTFPVLTRKNMASAPLCSCSGASHTRRFARHKKPRDERLGIHFH